MIPVYYVPIPQTSDHAVLSPLHEKLSPAETMQAAQINPYSTYQATSETGWKFSIKQKYLNHRY